MITGRQGRIVAREPSAKRDKQVRGPGRSMSCGCTGQGMKAGLSGASSVGETVSNLPLQRRNRHLTKAERQRERLDARAFKVRLATTLSCQSGSLVRLVGQPPQRVQSCSTDGTGS